jgi:hypothetical protein
MTVIPDSRFASRAHRCSEKAFCHSHSKTFRPVKRYTKRRNMMNFMSFCDSRGNSIWNNCRRLVWVEGRFSKRELQYSSLERMRAVAMVQAVVWSVAEWLDKKALAVERLSPTSFWRVAARLPRSGPSIQLGGLGSAVRSPRGVWGIAPAPTVFMHFKLCSDLSGGRPNILDISGVYWYWWYWVSTR